MRLGPKQRAESGGTGKIAGARQLYSLIRGMSIEEIEEQVRLPPRLLFVSIQSDIESLAEELTGVRGTPSIEFVTPDRLPRDLEPYDFVVVHNPEANDDYLAVRKSLGAFAHRVFDFGPNDDPDRIIKLRDRMAEHAGDAAMALGRWYPAFRSAAARTIINDTSRANAQFALLASAPSVIPVIGSMASVGADMIVLTRNQLLMAIKLAAVYGKPMNTHRDIFREITPVIGGGFVWRTIAREAATFLPFAAGAIPRVAIAFAGTYSTGKAVESYYRFGVKPTRDQLGIWYRQAMQLARTRFPGMRELPSAESIAPPG